MNQKIARQCQAEVWGDGKPSRQCPRSAQYERAYDSFSLVAVCGIHRRAADDGRGVWILLRDEDRVGTFFKPGHLRPLDQFARPALKISTQETPVSNEDPEMLRVGATYLRGMELLFNYVVDGCSRGNQDACEYLRRAGHPVPERYENPDSDDR